MATSFFRMYDGRKRFVLPAAYADKIAVYALMISVGAVAVFVLNCLVRAGFLIFAQDLVGPAPEIRWQLLLLSPVAFIVSTLAERHLHYWHGQVESGIVTEKMHSLCPESDTPTPLWSKAYCFKVLGMNRAGDVREVLVPARDPSEYDAVEVGQILHQGR